MIQPVYITKCGVKNACGSNPEEFFSSLKAKKSGISFHSDWDHLPFSLAATLSDYTTESTSPRRKDFSIDALPEIGFNHDNHMGIYLGCDSFNSDYLSFCFSNHYPVHLDTFGCSLDFESLFTERLKQVCELKEYPVLQICPDTSPESLVNHIRSHMGISGLNRIYNSLCVSSAQAVGEGFLSIAHNRESFCLCGGVEQFTFATAFTFSLLDSYSRADTPKQGCRPFHKNRSGIVTGEGAGFILLESEDHLLLSKNKPLCKIIGYAVNNNCHHPTQPDPQGDGFFRCMRQALFNAKLPPEKIDLITTHGTGTVLNDQAESRAIERLFPHKPYIQSIKSYIGHTLSASGVMNLIAATLQMNHKFLIPTLFLDEPDPVLNVSHVPEEGLEKSVSYCLCNASAFGGFNVSLVLESLQ